MNQSGSVLLLNERIMKNNYEIPPQLPCSSKSLNFCIYFWTLNERTCNSFRIMDSLQLIYKYLETIQYMIVNHVI